MPAFSHTLVNRLLAPGNFFLAPPLQLTVAGPSAETIPWEVFRGRLLNAAQTRQTRSFLSWNVRLEGTDEPAAGPVLSLKYDENEQQIHVVRGMLGRVWESYSPEEKVILSREAVRWVTELVASVRLAEYPDAEALESELAGALFHAVVGISRLPLTSLESPLPDFSLGRFGYLFGTRVGAAGPLRCAGDLLDAGFADRPPSEWVKRFELALRATPPAEGGDLALRLAAGMRDGKTSLNVAQLLRRLVNDVSLTPWTGFVDTLLAFVGGLVRAGVLTEIEEIDFQSWVIRQIVRHLSAYDLITFHHSGANYPDALFLDAVLKEYLRRIDTHAELLAPSPDLSPEEARLRRLRRRALRHGWLLRRFYEGHPVPDAPTSPGENARVLPPPHAHVSEEQISLVHRRRKFLYAGDSLEPFLTPPVRAALVEALADLAHPEELRELGTGIFIDRPLGWGKAPGEPDRTLLFAHEAFSRSLALRRLEFLATAASDAPELEWPTYREKLQRLDVRGVPAATYRHTRRGVVSLGDVFRAGQDFVLLRTTPGTVREFLRQYPLDALRAELDLSFLADGRKVLILPEPEAAPGRFPVLIVYEGQMPRLELEIDLSRGYRVRSNCEYPAAGLRVLAIHR